jgi:hypothetical protein
MTRTHGALAMLALCFALVGATTAVAAATQPIPPAVEDQHDRLLRNLRAGEAERTQAAVELVRFMERNLPPLPAVNSTATQPTPRADTAVPGRDVNVLATLLLGLTLLRTHRGADRRRGHDRLDCCRSPTGAAGSLRDLSCLSHVISSTATPTRAPPGPFS